MIIAPHSGDATADALSQLHLLLAAATRGTGTPARTFHLAVQLHRACLQTASNATRCCSCNSSGCTFITAPQTRAATLNQECTPVCMYMLPSSSAAGELAQTVQGPTPSLHAHVHAIRIAPPGWAFGINCFCSIDVPCRCTSQSLPLIPLPTHIAQSMSCAGLVEQQARHKHLCVHAAPCTHHTIQVAKLARTAYDLACTALNSTPYTVRTGIHVP
jgi:hypothetical protein